MQPQRAAARAVEAGGSRRASPVSCFFFFLKRRDLLLPAGLKLLDVGLELPHGAPRPR